MRCRAPSEEFIVVTESGILHQMQKAAPHKTFIPAPPEASCACNECPHMRKYAREGLPLAARPHAAARDGPRLLERARKPIDRMLALS
jgi:quinolinate synthase